MHGSVIMYYRGPGETYSQQNSVTLSTRTDSTEQELRFTLNSPAASQPTSGAASGPKMIEALRLNLVGGRVGSGTAYLKLYGIHVDMHRDGLDQQMPLCSIDSVGDIGDAVVTRGLTPCDGPLGDMYAIGGDEPTIEIVLAEAAALDRHSWLEVVLSYDYLPSEDFILARDMYLVEREKLEQEIRSLQNQLQREYMAAEEYRTHQGSPLWKLFTVTESWRARFSQAASRGIVSNCTRVFRPDWWSRRGLTGYERWRAGKGYENKSK